MSTTSRRSVPVSDYDSADPKTLLGDVGVQQQLVNKQGLVLNSYFWPTQPAAKAKALLLYVHGHGSHILFELLKSTGPGKIPVYQGSWLEALNAADIAVCGIDNQGCGRSEGLHGLRFYIESFDDYVDDVLQLARSLNDAPVPGFKGLPVFICGASLGGCIAYCASLREGELFKGTVLLAPMLSLERVSKKGCNPYLRPVSALVSKVWPSGELVAAPLADSPFPEIKEELDADPLAIRITRKTRVRNATEYLRATAGIMAGLERTEFPFLVFHSENDTMCDCDGSKQLFHRAKSADKQLRLVNDMWHVVGKEPGNEKVLANIIDWVLARA